MRLGIRHRSTPTDRVARIKSQVPVSLFLAAYGGRVTKGGWGGWASMVCPFHNDRSPSASVNVAQGRFKCHACGVSGDVIDLVMQLEGLSLNDALDRLEERYLR